MCRAEEIMPTFFEEKVIRIKSD